MVARTHTRRVGRAVAARAVAPDGLVSGKVARVVSRRNRSRRRWRGGGCHLLRRWRPALRVDACARQVHVADRLVAAAPASVGESECAEGAAGIVLSGDLHAIGHAAR